MKPLELYIHIPFCVKKCDYCDFLSGPADACQQEAYVEALIKEIQSVREERERPVTSFLWAEAPPPFYPPDCWSAFLRR